MKKPTLVLQFRTDASYKHEIDCYLKNGGYKKSDFKVVNVLQAKNGVPKVKDLSKYQAVITAASGEFNISDWPDEIRKKIEKLSPLFRGIVEKEVPTLAVCFGNQVIANLFGGNVKRDEKKSETGTFQVSLTKKGKNSPLFKGIPKRFYVVLGHKDSVIKLPKGAIHLATTKKNKYTAYRLGKNFYGIQFHPELDLDGLMWRLNLYPEYLKGRTLDEVRKDYQEIPYATKIIANFKKIVEANGIK